MTHCELCETLLEKAIWKNRFFYAIDASTDEFPCFIRIVSVKHVAEMSELSESERLYLWRLLETLEEAMRKFLSPDKINYAQFGNFVPHLHWHMIARWRDDAYFPECPWGSKQRTFDPRTTQERRAHTKELLKALPALLDAVDLPA